MNDLCEHGVVRSMCKICSVNSDEELIKKIAYLYTPEWCFDPAYQLMDKRIIKRCTKALDKAHKALALIRSTGYVKLAENQSVPEGEMCPRCDGSGYLYADGLAYYPSERVPTMRCPVCGGEGGVYPKSESLHAQGWRKVIEEEK